MRFEFQFASGREFRLWHLLSSVAVLGIICGFLPESIGVPIVFGVLCLGIAVIAVCLGYLVLQKISRR